MRLKDTLWEPSLHLQKEETTKIVGSTEIDID